MRTAYCRVCDNFGDKLNVPLLAQLSDIEAVWVPPRWADLIGIGSILCGIYGERRYRDGWRGTVLGAGMMHGVGGPNLRRARVLAIRGPLSARACGLNPERVRMGDPGLLAPMLATGKEGSGGTLVVPHNSDTELAELCGVPMLSLREDPVYIIRRFRAADEIITSALHAIILADALGIPRQWHPSDKVYGDGFKFHDYAASLGQELVPGRMQLAPADRVVELQGGLLAAFQELRG